MENSEIKVYEFEHFKNYTNIVHGIFARSGRTSTKSFDSLNIGINSKNIESVAANNRKLIISKMGMKPIVFLNQVHSTKIKVLKKMDKWTINNTDDNNDNNDNDDNDDNDFAKSFQLGKETYTADGIITDIKNLSLVIQVADCQAVILYDCKKKVIANIHSGWRGSVKNIIGECLDQMVSHFCCKPENIIAGISPSLGPCCSEFVNYKNEIPETFWKYKRDDKDYFDFWKISCDQLIDKGVKKENIENMEICTKCNVDQFYSYRAENTTGRFACVISMI